MMFSFAIKLDIFIRFQESINNKKHLDSKERKELFSGKRKMNGKLTGILWNHSAAFPGRAGMSI